MVRRKKKSRRRSPKTISMWNLAEGYISLSMLTAATLGTSPMNFVLGASDIAKIQIDPGLRGGLR